MRAPLAAGARFVLLDGAPAPVDMTQDEIGLAYNWRAAPPAATSATPSYLAATHAFAGAACGRSAPCTSAARARAGDLTLTWVRRTRIGGDSWDGVEVPLGEDSERYEIDILDGADVMRTLVRHDARRHLHRRPADRRLRHPATLRRPAHLPAQRHPGRGTPRDATPCRG